MRNQPYVRERDGELPSTPTRTMTPAPVEGLAPSEVYYQDRIVFWYKFPNRKARRRQRYEAKLRRRPKKNGY